MIRVALGVEYNGQGYYGWQWQREVPSIQGELQTAISKVANEEIQLQCAGRTDANVHATGQVVHFDTKAKRHIDAWIWGVNSHLPPGIVVHWARHVDFHFHARFSAKARRYRYIIYNTPIRPAILQSRVCWEYYPLDVARMQAAATCLIGEQDFSSFRAAECGSKSPMRNVTEVTITRHGQYVVLEIEANAFLHHMVRNIVGSLMKVGAGLKEVAWFHDVLAAKDRRVAAETAHAQGLYLIQVRYPDQYNFPPPSPMFLL